MGEVGKTFCYQLFCGEWGDAAKGAFTLCVKVNEFKYCFQSGDFKNDEIVIMTNTDWIVR